MKWGNIDIDIDIDRTHVQTKRKLTLSSITAPQSTTSYDLKRIYHVLSRLVSLYLAVADTFPAHVTHAADHLDASALTSAPSSPAPSTLNLPASTLQATMGMPIQNLHSPTVGSNNTAAAADNASLTDLIARKDVLESELKALGSVLDSVSHIPPALYSSTPATTLSFPSSASQPLSPSTLLSRFHHHPYVTSTDVPTHTTSTTSTLSLIHI